MEQFFFNQTDHFGYVTNDSPYFNIYLIIVGLSTSCFTAIDFDADVFAGIIKSSGAKYIVLTSKHHEGFTLWPSKQSWGWNAVDVGPARDLLGEVRNAILKAGGIHWGTYFSLLDWFHPLYLADEANNGNTSDYQVSYPQLLDLVNNYQPDVIWADGDWGPGMDENYYKSKEFLAWLYNESPVKDTVAVNDRWGDGMACNHGGYFTCEDHYNPGQLQTRKWEDSDTLDGAGPYGYRRTIRVAITRLVQVISKGGNYLLNIGPDSNGRVLPLFEQRLIEIGNFVRAHDEAIFKTKPWIFQNDDNLNSSSPVWYTSKLRNTTGFDPYRVYNPQQQQNTIVYAFVLSWPDDNKVNLTKVIPTSSTVVNLFGANNQSISMTYTQQSGGIQIDISGLSLTKFPSTDVFVLKIEYAADQKVNPIG
uniref:alpha-L-fucosidase n=1 Tax=Acrobeloides nanus TaxID=290746 RepID=A0A914E9S6_9BILA